MIRVLKYDSTEQLTQHINAREIRCKCGGTHDTIINTELLEKIESVISDIASFEDVTPNNIIIFISSGYRCRTHDINVGGNGNGTHTTGNAIDFKIVNKKTCKTYDNRIIAALLQEHGFTGIGRIDNDYIHGDIAPLSAHFGSPWYGDETVSGGTSGSVLKGNMTYWGYYHIKKPEVKHKFTIDVEISIDNKIYSGTLSQKEA